MKVTNKATIYRFYYMKFLLFLLAISLIVYSNTLFNSYAVDDASVTTKNTLVTKGISSIPFILSTPYRYGFLPTPNDFYRPLSLVFFATEFQLFGNSPLANHLINNLVFGGCVILLFIFLNSFFEYKKTMIAFFIALLFALHPIHTEVVANIKSLDELLCFFFVFCSLNIFTKYMRTGKVLFLCIGFLTFFLALLAKETAITFVLITPLIFINYLNNSNRRAIFITISTLITAGIFLVIRYVVLKNNNIDNSAPISLIDNLLANPLISFETKISTAIFILGCYFKLLFIPYSLICDYSYNSIPYTTFYNPLVILTILVYVSLIIFSIYRLFKKRKDLIAFSIIFYIVTISLFSNLLFFIGSNMAERFLFFPSVGFCMIIGLFIDKNILIKSDNLLILFKKNKILWFILPVLILYSIQTIIRNSEWKNNFTLFTADVNKNPNSARLNHSLAEEIENNLVPYEEDKQKKNELRSDAIAYLKNAVEIYHDFEMANTQLGILYLRSSQLNLAAIYEEKAFSLNHKNVYAINTLAEIYFRQKKYEKSIEMNMQVALNNENKAITYTHIGACYANLQKLDSAIYYLHIAIDEDANYKPACQNLIAIYTKLNMVDSAAKYAALSK